MELTFNKVSESQWEATFEASSDFNIHLERNNKGSITIAQRTAASGLFAPAFNIDSHQSSPVFDFDFGALVYPKWIKVISSSEVIKGEVTFA